MKLRAKFSLTVVGLLAAAITLVSGIMLIYQRQTLTHEADRQNIDMVQRLARVTEESLYQSDVIVLNYLKEIVKERAVTFACVTDSAGRITAHSDPNQIGSHLDLNADPALLVYSHDVKLGASIVGLAHVFIDQPRMERAINAALFQTMRPLLMISGLVLLLGIIGALLAATALIRPIERIVGGMRAIAEGSFAPLPRLRRNDELGWMADELNVMAARLKEVDEMKREFVSSVTHELRSPLTAIDRFASLLLQQFYGPVTIEQRESLITVKNNTVRLRNFIDDVLTSARFESQKIDVYFETMDVRQLVRDIHELFAPLALEKQLVFDIDLPNEPLMANVDRLKMTQVLTNLVSNAFKFTKHGRVAVKAEAVGAMLVFNVSDTGTGISDADKTKLFERFFRAQGTASTHSGTGLGLAIVKGLLDLLGGKVEVFNNSDAGTVFRVTVAQNSRPEGESVAFK